MTLLRMDLDLEQIAQDARLSFGELQQARNRARRATLRRLQTVARQHVRRSTPIRGQSINRRIRAYVRQERLWIGADARYAPLASSFRPPRVRLGRRRGNRPRSVTVDGQLVEGAFVPTSGRLAGRSVRRTGSGRGLEPVRVDIRPQMEAGFGAAERQLRPVFDFEFLAAANRIARR